MNLIEITYLCGQQETLLMLDFPLNIPILYNHIIDIKKLPNNDSLLELNKLYEYPKFCHSDKQVLRTYGRFTVDYSIPDHQKSRKCNLKYTFKMVMDLDHLKNKEAKSEIRTYHLNKIIKECTV